MLHICSMTIALAIIYQLGKEIVMVMTRFCVQGKVNKVRVGFWIRMRVRVGLGLGLFSIICQSEKTPSSTYILYTFYSIPV